MQRVLRRTKGQEHANPRPLYGPASLAPSSLPSNPIELIRKRELAKLLSVNAWTVDNWRKKGLLPPPLILSPQVVAWRRTDIEVWLAERQAQPAATRTPAKKKGARR